MAGYVYAGESDGGRIVRFNASTTTQVTTSDVEFVLGDIRTWDFVPMGPSGDSVFRNVIVTVSHTNGFNIRVTPYIDDEALPAQEFSGVGNGTQDCQAWIARRGARLSVRAEQLANFGQVEWVNIEVAYTPIRRSP